MKDLPHHMNKLNRSIIRSQHREEGIIEKDDLSAPRHQTEKQIKKQAKSKIAHERTDRTPIHLTEEERNNKMRKRVPVFDRMNREGPKTTKAPRNKKTPRI